MRPQCARAGFLVLRHMSEVMQQNRGFLRQTSPFQGRKNRNRSSSSQFTLVAAATAAAGVASATRAENEEVTSPLRRRFSEYYRFVEKTAPLGRGACSTVLAAVHRETGEVVAVKRMLRSESTTEEVLAEVATMRLAGEHRNVLQLQDAFWDDEYWYLVLEHAKGGELFDRLVNRGLLSERETAAVMRDLTGAVAFLHMNGIVHGDVKPENILLASDASGAAVDVRLGDFGSAAEADDTGIVRNGGRGVTVAYSPPEVLAREDGGGVSEKADIWALGILMFILICGRHPFDPAMDADEAEIERRICDGSISFSDPIWRHYPLAVDLLRRMLAADPRDRPPAEKVLRHRWFSADPLRDVDPDPQSYTKDAFHRFCAGRRRLKAVMLAVMTGVLVGPPEDDEVDGLASATARPIPARQGADAGVDGDGEPTNAVTGAVGAGTGAGAAAGAAATEDAAVGTAAGAAPISGGYASQRNLMRLTSGRRRMIGSRAVACRRIDRGGKGYISADDLAYVLRRLGEEATESDVAAMMYGAGGDPTEGGSGSASARRRTISYEQMTRLVPPLCPARVFAPGEVVYREGESDPTLYLVKRGAVSFSLAAPGGGGDVLLQSLGEGASFGEVELLGADGATLPRVCTCRCAVPVQPSPSAAEGSAVPGGVVVPPLRCELLAVPKDLFSLLTDVLQGVGAKVMEQAEVRLMQVSSELLARGFSGIARRAAAGQPLWPLSAASAAAAVLVADATEGVAPETAAEAARMVMAEEDPLLASGDGEAMAATAPAGDGDMVLVVRSGAAMVTYPSGVWPAGEPAEDDGDAGPGRSNSGARDAVTASAAVAAEIPVATAQCRRLGPGDFCFCGAGAARLGAAGAVAVVSDAAGTVVLLVPLADVERALMAPNMTALAPALLGH